MRGDWQRIATAPKDGTLVRLKRVYQGETVTTGRGYFGEVTITYGGGPYVSIGGIEMAEPSTETYRDVWVDEDKRHLFPTPTHWMPLPDPPVTRPRHGDEAA